MERVPNHVAGRWRELCGATAFLTRLPAGRLAAADGIALADAAWAFPLVGVLVGGVGGAVLLGAAGLGLHPLACALLGVAAGVALTGALHEDGLADLADGFGGGTNREAKLSIMRDSRVGTFGVLALVFTVGLRTAILAGLMGPIAAGAALIAGAALSRGLMVPMMAWMRPARADGLGAGAGRPTTGAALIAVAIGFLTAIAVLGIETATWTVLAGGAAALLMAWVAGRQVGGQTGDVLGATQQVGEIAVLLAAAGTSL